MCLAVPGKILATDERNGSRMARVQFGGIVREVSLEFEPEAREGDYVLVHVGFAISRVDAEEAARIQKTLDEMDRLGGDAPEDRGR
ncbi:MAG: HypC/HybG/HupF family hydrogenase formation chaperone [Planctomycetota bacterium]|jgi:hydrogenase expression/formation protein HypC